MTSGRLAAVQRSSEPGSNVLPKALNPSGEARIQEAVEAVARRTTPLL